MAEVQAPLPVPIPSIQGQQSTVEPPVTVADDTLAPVFEDDAVSTNLDEHARSPPVNNVETDGSEPTAAPTIPELPLEPSPFFEPEEPENPSLPIPSPEDIPIDLAETFPFTEEEEIDKGRAFIGTHPVHRPETIESLFPFFDLPTDSESMRDAVPRGNFVEFFQSKVSHEFYRNYLRGDTLGQLRSSKLAIKGKPGSLAKFLELPLELFFDILELVHPMDLLHLSRSSKAFGEALNTERAEKVWAASYSNHSDSIPRMHNLFSGVKWTGMLFSHSRCDFCGRLGALNDFAYNEHYCDECQGKYLLERHQIRDIHSAHSRQVEKMFDLIVPTYRQCGRKFQTVYEAPDNARYRKKDVDEMLKTLTSWYITIDEGMITQAGEMFEKWAAAREQEVEIINVCAQNANNWAMNLSYNRSNRFSERQRLLADKIASRLVKLGFDARDTASAQSDFYYVLRLGEITKLNSSIFESYKDEFISKIDYYKNSRLKQERRERVNQVYKDYKKTLKPEKWSYLPPEDCVACEEPFTDFIDQDDPKHLKEISLTEANERLPVIIQDWISQRQLELYESIPGAEMPQDPPEESTEGLSEEEVERRAKAQEDAKKEILAALMATRMNLATTVYTCINCKSTRQSGLAIIGWDAACAHICGSMPSYYHSNWEFCSVGYAAAANIIRSLGLNPETATSAEVDAVDARFFCMNCPVNGHRKLRGRKAMTWRECVTHAVEKEEDHTHAIHAWLRLSAEATTFVKHHESPAPLYKKPNWGCNHCPEHFDIPVLRKDAIEHVKTTHSIDAPVQGIDFIDFKHRYEKGGFYRSRHIFHYSIEPTCNLICKVCRAGKVSRMWTIQALVPHLFHKHGISTPSSGRDYSKIEILSVD